MKKINNSGFAIVETIVVAVFVMGICSFLFANFLPLIADYERIEDYDNIEHVYKANEVRKLILREKTSLNALIKSSIVSNSGYLKWKEGDNSICNSLSIKNFCQKLFSNDYLGVDTIYITPFKLKNFKTTVKNDDSFSRSFKEYIEYLPSYDRYSSTFDSYYRLIIVYNDGNMANIEVIL